MLRGATPRAEEMEGTAVLRIVVSSDSMKKATATSHGKRRLEVSEGTHEDGGALNRPHRVAGRRLREGSSATHMFAQACSSVHCSRRVGSLVCAAHKYRLPPRPRPAVNVITLLNGTAQETATGGS